MPAKTWQQNMLGITFRYADGRITVFRSALESIGRPEFYHFLYNPTKQMFAIQACGMDAEGANRVPKKNQDDRYDVKSIHYPFQFFACAIFNFNVAFLNPILCRSHSITRSFTKCKPFCNFYAEFQKKPFGNMQFDSFPATHGSFVPQMQKKDTLSRVLWTFLGGHTISR